MQMHTDLHSYYAQRYAKSMSCRVHALFLLSHINIAGGKGRENSD
jgi:hypothetical protein